MTDPTLSSGLILADVLGARARLRGRVRRTPLQGAPSLRGCGCGEVFLKLEQQQITGSFKLRGASNAVALLSAAQRDRGVTGVSTGNHGRGLAWAARAAGVRASICMSRLVPANKVAAVRALGADVRIVGTSQDEADEEVARLVAEEGMVLLPPFDHPHVIAGQGTLGVEMVEDLLALAGVVPQTVVVPLSGGGLIAGIALALKSIDPSIRVIGVSMERGCAMVESLRAGHPVAVPEVPTLADSLGGGIGLDNRFTFDMVRRLVDETQLVSEAQIAAAVRAAYLDERQIVEGGGAVGVAALRAGLVRGPGPTVVLLSGGNIDMDMHRRIVNGERVEPEAGH